MRLLKYAGVPNNVSVMETQARQAGRQAGRQIDR